MATIRRKRYEIGDVRIWTKDLALIPVGWQLCDGTNGTPNTVDRAMVGAGNSYNHGDVFGADSPVVSLNIDSHTLATGEIAAHNHAGGVGNSNGGKYGGLSQSNSYHESITVSSATVKSPYTSSSGGDGAHTHSGSATLDTRQKSVAVNWIMRIY